MMRPRHKLLLATMATSLIALTLRPPLAGRSVGSSDGQAGIPSFREFIEAVRVAGYEQYAARSRNKVADEGAFAEMRAYILKMYEGIDVRQVRHSFTDESGSIFDCIPVDQQPALRGSRQVILNAPGLPRPGGETGARDGRLEVNPPLNDSRKDQYGNAMFCPSGAIPMQRITLEKLTGFETLQDFFQK